MGEAGYIHQTWNLINSDILASDEWWNSEAFSSSSAASVGKILWNGNWVTFLDALLHMLILPEAGRSLRLPTRIRSVSVDPVLHLEQVCQYKDNIEGNVSHAWAFDCRMNEWILK